MSVDVAALQRTLEAEAAGLRALVDDLRSEQAALVAGDTERVAALAAPKTQRLIELSRVAAVRRQLLERAGLLPDRAGMEILLARAGAGATAARSAWRQVLESTAAAHQLNTTNGMLIGTRLQNTQRALDVLFCAARVPGAYGANGATVSLRTAHTLAVA